MLLSGGSQSPIRLSSPLWLCPVLRFSFQSSCMRTRMRLQHSPYMIGANGSVRGKKEFEPSSLAAESEPLLGPHLEDY
jgi:hypothetical protein